MTGESDEGRGARADEGDERDGDFEDFEGEVVEVLVETPAGSRNKYELDERSGRFHLDRRLPSATVYPADYGFVPGTLGRDGDPLDALVLVEEPTFPGCVVRGRVLGMLVMEDEHGHDPKLIVVPEGEPRWREARGLEDVPQSLRDEIEHFFAVYKDLEPGREARTFGFGDLDAALRELHAAGGRAGRPEGAGPAGVEE